MSEPTQTEKIYLTPDEAAALLRKSRKAIYCMNDRGQLPGARKVGRSLLIHREILLRHIEKTGRSAA